MELHEFHIDQICAGIVGESMPITRVFPTVARDLVGATDTARGEHDRFCFEQEKTSTLPFVPKCAHDAVPIL